MEKWLCWATMGVSGLMFALFAMDLVMGLPFGGLNKVVDVLAAAAAGIIFYLGWDALQDVN